MESKIKRLWKWTRRNIKKHFYQQNQYDKYFNELSILYNTRKLSKKKYIKEIDPLLNGNKYENNCIKCNSKYIYTDENQQIFKDFIDTEEQVIAISSPYGTGKTYTFKQLIPKFNKILFKIIDKVLLIVHMMNYKNHVFEIIIN